jgi:hypothetical protein
METIQVEATGFDNALAMAYRELGWRGEYQVKLKCVIMDTERSGSDFVYIFECERI